jgi:riboflavin synthase
MFTGIIETVGEIKSIEKEGTNVHFDVYSPITQELKIDQSVAHDGVCLTIVAINGSIFRVTAIEETLQKSSLGLWDINKKINLERCMSANGRFDGHIVQGHVDQTGSVEKIIERDGSWVIDFSYEPGKGNITVEKGSVTVNGASLTCFNSKKRGFSVAIIPYTFENTNFHQLRTGDKVNIEFDIVGKYIQRMAKGYLDD